jgi:hypothetical protein
MQIGIKFQEHEVKNLIKREASLLTGVPVRELDVSMTLVNGRILTTVMHLDFKKDLVLKPERQV